MNALAEPITPSTDEMPAPLIFTDSAADKVRQLVEEEGNPDLKLRVFVQGGGCSGFQYGFTFDEFEHIGTVQDGIGTLARPHAASPRSPLLQPAGYSAPRTRGPRAPVAVGRLPGRRARWALASQANASASTCSGATPAAAVLLTVARPASSAASRCIRCRLKAPPPQTSNDPVAGAC